MRVDNENDRMEPPEDCDTCGSEVPLTRFRWYGPGHQVAWHCAYCAVANEHNITRTLGAMFNVLEFRLKGVKP